MSVKHSLGKDRNNRKVQLKKHGLQDIPRSIYSSLMEITHIDISYNLLNNKHLDLICRNCSTLKQLSIEGNIISLIPKSFRQLSRLEVFKSDWHLIVGDAHNKQQLLARGCKAVETIQKYRISSIKLFLDDNLRLVNCDGLRGINFRKFCQQICTIQLQPSICGLIIMKIQKLSINDSIKSEIISLLKGIMLGKSEILILKQQMNQSLKTIPRMFDTVNKSQPQTQIKSSLRFGRLSLQKAKSRHNYDNLFQTVSPGKRSIGGVSAIKLVHQRQIVIQRIKTLDHKQSPIKHGLSKKETLINCSQKHISNSSTGISFGMASIAQQEYGINYPFHRIFSKFRKNPQANIIQLQSLLEKGCNPNVFDDKGYTPYHIAAINGQFQILRYCIQRNKKHKLVLFDLQIKSQGQLRSILHISALLKNVQIMKILVETGFPINKRDKNGYKQIHLIDQNHQFLANYRKACRKRKWQNFVTEHTKKGVMISKHQILKKQRSAKLIEMFEDSVGLQHINLSLFSSK